MSEIENPPAFPVIAENGLGHVSEGMSLCDWFAGQIIGHIVFAELSSNERSIPPLTLAEAAYGLADAMIAARKAPRS